MRHLLMSDDHTDDVLKVEDEPALDFALPQVFDQPPLTALQRGKLRHVEWLVAKLYQLPSLGPDYQALVNEFEPLFAWSMACWDFLQSTEGCRFMLRQNNDRMYYRGDYRAVTHKDYSRLMHRIFRQSVLEFAQTAVEQSLSAYLRQRFWPAIVEAYRQLAVPPDPKQRRLTGYSYLRCAPYRFLNPFHHKLVTTSLQTLPSTTAEATSFYFLRFYTLDATGEAMRQPTEAVEDTLKRALSQLLIEQRLVYCLLRQIERY